LNPRFDHSETIEAIVRIWRGKPSSANDAKRYYNFSESYYIEDKLEEANLTKMKLPLISKKAIEEIKRDDYIEVDKIKVSDLVEDLIKLDQKETDWQRNKEISISFA
jgi:hypothetical protein